MCHVLIDHPVKYFTFNWENMHVFSCTSYFLHTTNCSSTLFCILLTTDHSLTFLFLFRVTLMQVQQDLWQSRSSIFFGKKMDVNFVDSSTGWLQGWSSRRMKKLMFFLGVFESAKDLMLKNLRLVVFSNLLLAEPFLRYFSCNFYFLIELQYLWFWCAVVCCSNLGKEGRREDRRGFFRWCFSSAGDVSLFNFLGGELGLLQRRLWRSEGRKKNIWVAWSIESWGPVALCAWTFIGRSLGLASRQQTTYTSHPTCPGSCPRDSFPFCETFSFHL